MRRSVEVALGDKLLTASLDEIMLVFFFNDTATTEIYTLSLHDALPICADDECAATLDCGHAPQAALTGRATTSRSEEHTSELQSQSNLVCRLLLEKKKNRI